ncbi:hypothetical protein GGR57DRAFT_456287 [Xylariaceae sp. FL1272]|nr:hypothetical protein GGR57DRAFT_456287 [Xylariaceae sp. FL1272]
MSRLIDTLPEPSQVLDKKVIVLSRSRVGTFSLYQALKMLGYKPYHMYEVVTLGALHMNLFEEALRCKYMNGGKPYGKAEFDKWLANYDTVVEIPQFFTEEFIQFYPDAKFILTERDIDSWWTSMQNTAGPMMKATRTFPLTAVAKIDTYTKAFCSLHVALESVCFNGKTIESKTGAECAKRDTIEISKKAKELVPADRLLVCRLEDGFGWEQICPFLGHGIPKEKYPKGNAPAEFHKLGKEVLMPGMLKFGAVVLSAVVIPAASAGAYYYMQMKRRP